MNQIKYKPYIVYNNLRDLLYYRKLKLIHGLIHRDKVSKDWLSEADFINHIQYYHHITVECIDNDYKNADKDQTDDTQEIQLIDKHTLYMMTPRIRRFKKSQTDYVKKLPVKTFIIILNMDNYYNKSVSFSKILDIITDEITAKYNIDMIIITPEKVSSDIEKLILKYQSDGSDTNGYYRINTYYYGYFYCAIPRHVAVPTMHIIPPHKEQDKLDFIYREKKELGKIKVSEPAMVWIGAEPDNIIKIFNRSESTMIETMYRLVI